MILLSRTSLGGFCITLSLIFQLGASHAEDSGNIIGDGDYVEAVRGAGDQYIGWVVQRVGEEVDVCLCGSLTVRRFFENELSPHRSDCTNRDRPKELLFRAQVLSASEETLSLQSMGLDRTSFERWHVEVPLDAGVEGKPPQFDVGDVVNVVVPRIAESNSYTAMQQGLVGVGIYQSASEVCRGVSENNFAIFEDLSGSSSVR